VHAKSDKINISRRDIKIKCSKMRRNEMKKFLAVMLALVAMLALVDCSSPKKTEGGLGETVYSGDLEFTLDSVTEYVDTSDGFIKDEPKAGKTFIILNFTVKNAGSKDEYINPFYYSAYVDDVSISVTPPLFYNYEGEDLSGDLAAGKTAKGYVALEVSKTFEKIDFIYEPMSGDKITVTVNKSDVK
jgi:hypothetical protein